MLDEIYVFLVRHPAKMTKFETNFIINCLINRNRKIKGCKGRMGRKSQNGMPFALMESRRREERK
jgi:hypothetical protein